MDVLYGWPLIVNFNLKLILLPPRVLFLQGRPRRGGGHPAADPEGDLRRVPAGADEPLSLRGHLQEDRVPIQHTRAIPMQAKKGTKNVHDANNSHMWLC